MAGSFHDHSTDSDGNMPADRIADWEYSRRNELGLDFASLSDHSDAFPFAYRAPLDGNLWQHQAEIADRFTAGGFVFMRNFEYTSDEENHLGVIGSSDFPVGPHWSESSMRPFYHWLEASDGVGQFNHPSTKGALQWDGLAYDVIAAQKMAAIEIYGDQNFTHRSLQHSDAGWYWLALQRGWTVGPVMNWDEHDWKSVMDNKYGDGACGMLPILLPCQRTLVLATSRTREGLMEALRARRTSATEHPSLWATLRSGATWQGSTLAGYGAGDRIRLTVDAGSLQWPLTSVEIVSDNGIDPHPYYDADIQHCSSDVTDCDNDDEHDAVEASYRLEHERFVQSGGYTVRKSQIDGPPPLATILTLPLHGSRAHVTFDVVIPAVRSLRPDGKHFFYAIVHAGQVRAWTAPIFTTEDSDTAH